MAMDLETGIMHHLREYCKNFSHLFNDSIFDLQEESAFETQNSNLCLRVKLMPKNDSSKFIGKAYNPADYGYENQEFLRKDIVKFLRDKHHLDYKGHISEILPRRNIIPSFEEIDYDGI